MQVAEQTLSGRVDATAERLRIVQLDFGDEAPESRRAYLASEVRQALEQIPRDEQEAFLAMLGERFPALTASEDLPGTVIQRELSIPEMVGELSAKGRSLPLAQRQSMLKQLQQAWGMQSEMPASPREQPIRPQPPRAEPPPVQSQAQPRSTTSPSAPVDPAVLQRLGIPANAAVDPALLAKLTNHLLDFALPLHPLVTRIWRSMSGNSELAERPLSSSVQCFVQGRHAGLPSELLQLRALIAAMINALPHLSEPFCDSHLLRFQPDEIEEAVRTESSFTLWGGDNKLWAKYKQMAPMLQPPAVNESIRSVFNELVGSAMQATVTATKVREGDR